MNSSGTKVNHPLGKLKELLFAFTSSQPVLTCIADPILHEMWPQLGPFIPSYCSEFFLKACNALLPWPQPIDDGFGRCSRTLEAAFQRHSLALATLFYILAPPITKEYQCFCTRAFTTPQGLATHKRLAHNIGAQERHLIDGVTCPCCLKFLWTRQRLYQHLAYIPRKGQVNHCFQMLQSQGFQVTDDSAPILGHTPAGLNRSEALQAFGPQPLFKDSRDKELLLTKQRLAL